MKKLGIVVLAFNETYSLIHTVEELQNYLGSQHTEIIIATSNNATRECKEIAIECAKKYTNTSVYIQKEPYVAAAVLESVAQLSSDLVLYMSSDGETPPKVIPEMLKRIEAENLDIVAASRWINGGSFSGYGRVKYLVSWLAQQLCRILFGFKIREYTYGFRLYKREIFTVCKFSERRHPFFLETLLIPIRLGYTVGEIPVHWVPRTEGISVVSHQTLLSYLRPIFRVRIAPKFKLKSKEDSKANDDSMS